MAAVAACFCAASGPLFLSTGENRYAATMSACTAARMSWARSGSRIGSFRTGDSPAPRSVAWRPCTAVSANAGLNSMCLGGSGVLQYVARREEVDLARRRLLVGPVGVRIHRA